MVKSFLLLFLFSLSFTASASCYGLAEGEVIRLDASGLSLDGFKTQDQDGLGTCASNAGSLLLQSLLPDHPSVSYLHLASVYKRDELNAQRKEQLSKNGSFDVYAKMVQNSTTAVNPNRKEKDKWQLGIDSATVCGVIEAAKANQKNPGEGTCRSQAVNLEKMAGPDDLNWLQQKSVLAVSQYMNQFQKDFSDALFEKENAKSRYFNFLKEKKYSEEEIARNAEARRRYQEFKLALEAQINQKEILFGEQCKNITADVFNAIYQSLASHFLRYSFCFEGDPSRYQLCEVLRKIVKVVPAADGALKADINVDLNNAIMQSLGSYLTAKNKPVTAPELRSKLFPVLESMRGGSFTAYEKNAITEAINAIPESVINKTASEINDIKALGYSKECNERKLINYLSSNEFKTEAKNNKVLCQNFGLISSVESIITSTAMTGLSDISKIKAFLLNDANLNFDEVMMKLYAFDCRENDKVKIPEKLTCEETIVDHNKKTEVNQKIMAELKNNRAMTSTVCAAIFEKPKSQFLPDECGYHAVGIIGLKCSEGSLKYLIQNSWGASSKARNPAIENDSPGKGAYWLDEQSFFDGTISLQRGSL